MDKFLHIQTAAIGISGMTEIYDVIYDKNITSFDEFLYLEQVAFLTAKYAKWKIFKAFPSSVGSLMFCKN